MSPITQLHVFQQQKYLLTIARMFYSSSRPRALLPAPPSNLIASGCALLSRPTYAYVYPRMHELRCMVYAASIPAQTRSSELAAANVHTHDHRSARSNRNAEGFTYIQDKNAGGGLGYDGRPVGRLTARTTSCYSHLAATCWMTAVRT